MTYVISIVLFASAFSLFFFVNISFLLKKFNKMKQSYFMGDDSLVEQLRFFSVTEKNLLVLNVMGAVILGLLGVHLRIGIFGVLFGLATGWILPGALLKYNRRKHLNKLSSQFVPALTLLANAMKAGETLPQAIGSVGKVLGYQMSREFGIILRQMKMGMGLNEALTNFADRIPLSDITLSIRAMLVSIKTGANLPSALSRIATTIRERNKVEGKIKALTTQGRAQGIVMTILPIALGGFLYWMDPEYIGILFNTMLGHCVVAFIIVSDITAFFVIRKMVSVTV